MIRFQVALLEGFVPVGVTGGCSSSGGPVRLRALPPRDRVTGAPFPARCTVTTADGNPCRETSGPGHTSWSVPSGGRK
ncbi:MAG TPA: hypothetical protein PLI31_04385 [Methanoregulaceae archaeon]|nr:hypothetical protein [Methanoregulaceae archaeon]